MARITPGFEELKKANMVSFNFLRLIQERIQGTRETRDGVSWQFKLDCFGEFVF